MLQLPHYSLDNVLIHAIEEGDFSVCHFNRANACGRIDGEVGEKEFLLTGSRVTGTMVNFCCGIRKHLLKLIQVSYQEMLLVYMRSLNSGLQ